VGYLGLGSNVGDRESHLRAAIEELRERGVRVEAVSSLYETEPVGEVTDQPDFLNGAVSFSTSARRSRRRRAGTSVARVTAPARSTSTCCSSARSR
jgi:2-amino-4-hydroxy-6-hydroxymethyldihydropteridine diphosphokinase